LAHSAAAFVVAVALHTAWDSSPSLVWTAAITVVSPAFLGWTVHRVAVGQRGDRRPLVVQLDLQSRRTRL
jgi:hypothetical protein